MFERRKHNRHTAGQFRDNGASGGGAFLRANRRNLALLAGLLALGLAGCSTVQEARQAQDPRRTPLGERTPIPAELGLYSNTVLSLDKAISIAMRTTPQVAIASQNLTLASQQVVAARAAQYPTANGSAGYQHNMGNSHADLSSFDSAEGYSAGVNADYTIYDFGKLRAQSRQRRAQLQAAQARFRSTANDTYWQTATAFYDLCQAQALVGINQEALRQFNEHLKQTQVLVEIGNRTRYDLTKAEVDLENARLELLSASNACVAARAVLIRRLGLIIDPGFVVQPPTAQDPSTGSLTGSLAIAYRDNPDLQALRHDQTAAMSGVDAAVADIYPSLNFSLGGVFSGDHFPLLWSLDSMLQFNLPLFDGDRRRTAVVAAITDLRAARSTVADREQQLTQDLTAALSTQATAEQRVRIDVLQVRKAAENLELVDERYRIGSASAVDRTDATVALVQAEIQHTRDHYVLASSDALVRRLTGRE